MLYYIFLIENRCRYDITFQNRNYCARPGGGQSHGLKPPPPPTIFLLSDKATHVHLWVGIRNLNIPSQRERSEEKVLDFFFLIIKSLIIISSLVCLHSGNCEFYYVF